MLGQPVTVTGFDDGPGGAAVAVCRVGRQRHRVLVTELQWQTPPTGVAWIEAYRPWISGRW